MSVEPARWRRERWDEASTIYFWSGRGGEYQSLSNFAATPFVMAAWQSELGVVEFATAEHAFQAAKAANVSEHERIRLAATPLDAKRAGRRAQLPADWDRRRLAVMLTVVRAKFAAGPLRDLLVGTGDRLLAEDSPYDAVWGCRDRIGGYTGSNLLGRALMRVRDELREPRIDREGLVLLRVTGPRFVGGAEADQGRVTRTAPIIKRLRGRPVADAITLAEQQGWNVEVISPTTGRDNNTGPAVNSSRGSTTGRHEPRAGTPPAQRLTSQEPGIKPSVLQARSIANSSQARPPKDAIARSPTSAPSARRSGGQGSPDLSPAQRPDRGR